METTTVYWVYEPKMLHVWPCNTPNPRLLTVSPPPAAGRDPQADVPGQDLTEISGPQQAQTMYGSRKKTCIDEMCRGRIACRVFCMSSLFD